VRMHIDAVGLALAAAGEVGHYDGPGGRVVDPELVGFGAYEVCSAEACGDDERCPGWRCAGASRRSWTW